jgi:hypothetical protein
MVLTISAVIRISVEGGATSKLGKARFGKCRLTITPPEFIKGVRERRIFRKKKLAGEDPLDPLPSKMTHKGKLNEFAGVGKKWGEY